MKWVYSFTERAKAASLLAIVLVVVFMASVISKRNVSQLGDSFESVYNDRLVVESYIYKFSDYLYQKKIMMDECRPEQFNDVRKNISLHNEAILLMIASYEKTKLTKEERISFDAFKKDMNDIMKAESNIGIQELPQTKSLIESHVNNALARLSDLSAIQLSEGKLLNDNSKKIIAGTDVMTQFEMAVLIVIGLIIQVLIFASKSFTPKAPQNHSLN